MSKRGLSGRSCLLALNKPIGMSSHDVVNVVRRVFNERRVGHAGTLDPQASGVLLVCVGPATRLDAYLVGHGAASGCMRNRQLLMRTAYGARNVCAG